MDKKLAVLALGAALAACGSPDSAPLQDRVSGCVAPGAPSGLRGNPGPGPAQATVAWSAPSGNGGAAVVRYTVYRDGRAFARLGNTLAYGDTGVGGSHSYHVTATNTCGAEGPASEAISVSALPGTLITAPVTPSNAATARFNTYKVLNPAGQEIGQRT